MAMNWSRLGYSSGQNFLWEREALRDEVQLESQGRQGSRGSRSGAALTLRCVVADLGLQES